MTAPTPDDPLQAARAFYARQMAAVSGWTDPRLERAFETVRREDFLPRGPWLILAGGTYVRTPNADPVHLYQNVLVALDPKRGINNGEPFLHAAWIGAVAPQPGETVTHVGAGTGYYTAILSRLVEARGRVIGFEIDRALADAARANCAPFANVSIVHRDAVAGPVEASDIIYVNAGVVAPPRAWLEALKPGGRLIFPWRPAGRIGLAMLAIRGAGGFSVRSVGGAWFIPCEGASDPALAIKPPSKEAALGSRSIVLSEHAPDATATAIYRDLWFSSRDIGG